MNIKWVACLVLGSLSFAVKAETGVTDNRILLGQTVGLTGIVSGPVREMNEGANAYFAAINAKGGVYGRKIELVTLDDKFDPALSALNAQRLIKTEKVFAMFMGRGTPHTEAVAPLLEANKIPLIAPATGAAIFHNPVNHWIFNVRAKLQDEVAKGVEHFATLGLKSVGILYVDTSAGLDGLEGFRKAMEVHHMTPAIVAKYALVKPDYVATAASIVKANPSALVIVSSSANTAGVIKAIRAQGNHMQILTLSNSLSKTFLTELGADGAGVIVTQVTPAPDLVTSVLGQEYKLAAKLTGASISYSGIEGFINAKLLVAGLQRAGRNLTREGFIDALESMDHVDLGGVTVTYGKNDHTGSEFVELTMIGKNGGFVR